ncbi:MAG: hypothetical protein WDM94_06990 [Bauldia sp.]
METMIVAGQAAAFAKSRRQGEDAFYRQQAPRRPIAIRGLDVVLAVALIAFVAVGVLTA